MTNLLERINNVEKANKLWKRMNEIIDLQNVRNDDYTDQINKLVGELENALYFKDQQQHEKWLEILQSYKFWEDFEESTISIIHQEEDTLETICESLYECARTLARQLDFETLYNAFTTVEKSWLSTIDNLEKWFKKLSRKDKEEYKNNFKEYYDKDFNIVELKEKYYAFELCSIPMYYENNKDGKIDLFECIFERYLQGSFRDDMPFLISFINELLNADLFQLLRNYKKAIKEFDNDIKHNCSTKGSLDHLEDVQADVYEWVEKNM